MLMLATITATFLASTSSVAATTRSQATAIDPVRSVLAPASNPPAAPSTTGGGSGSAVPGPGPADDCASATPISGFGTFLGDTIGWTSDGPIACIVGLGGTVWYDWTATTTATTRITLCNFGTDPGWDASLTVFDTSSCVGSLVTCNDDTIPGTLDCPTVAFVAVSGNVYKLRIMGSIGAPGFFEMSIAPQFTSFCEPGSASVQACPCGNAPSGPGRGCNNFGSATGGAVLTPSGSANLFPDQLYLTATDENASAFTVFFSGSTTTAPTGAIHGAGIRCVNGLKRLYNGAASGGTIARPLGSDPSVSARSAAVGAPITPGDTRYYFTIYRDPMAAGPCGNPAITINLSNAVAVDWAP